MIEIQNQSEHSAINLPEFPINIDGSLWMESYRPFNRTIQFYLNNICNLRCDKCFVRDRLVTPAFQKQLPIETIGQVIDNNPDIPIYDLMGGEPGLYPDLDKCVQFLVEKGKRTKIYTNAIEIDRFIDLPKKDVSFHITIQSMSGEDPSRKPLERIKGNIEKISKLFSTQLNFLVDRGNTDELKLFLAAVKKDFPEINTVKIGCARDETDYENDNLPGILAFTDYATLINELLNNPTYEGPSKLNIFAEGVLTTPKMPINQPNQYGRIKCVFPEGLAESIYGIAIGQIHAFNPKEPIDFDKQDGFYISYGHEWTDQIQLERKSN